MHFTDQPTRFNVRTSVSIPIYTTVRIALSVVILATSLVLYKITQRNKIADMPSDPDQRTLMLTAEITAESGAGQDVQPVRPFRRLDLTAAREVQPATPIRRISLPAGLTKDLQPIESFRRIDLA